MENLSEMSTEEFKENLNGKARIFPRQDVEERRNEIDFNWLRQAFEDLHKELDARVQANDEWLDKIITGRYIKKPPKQIRYVYADKGIWARIKADDKRIDEVNKLKTKLEEGQK